MTPLVAAAAVAAGAAVQSATGFGFSIVAAPLVFATVEPEQAVGLLIILGSLVSVIPLIIAFRIGQRKNVQVRKLTCVGTLEERIDQLIAVKKDLAEQIVGSGEAWLTELDTAQLRELVALTSEAVAA